MTTPTRTIGFAVACATLLVGPGLRAQDWPQWRGANRDARARGFKAPSTWPKELTQKWKATVGNGVATPALVGNRLFVFTREGSDEVIRCLDAATGKDLWKDSYPAEGARGLAGRFPGPRSSPTVQDGKVVTLGVRGTLSCLNAGDGKVLWRKETTFSGKTPRFFTSCSPLVVDDVCIVQLGGEQQGGMAAYDLGTGKQRWVWTGDGTAYSSPVLLTVDGTKAVVAETAANIVGIGATDGKLLWKTRFAVRGRGYNAATPIVSGDTVIFAGSGRGIHAVRIEKTADGLTTKDLWSNPQNSVMFSTPVLRDGLIYGISDRSQLFCVDAKNGKTDWTTPISGGRGYGSVVDAGPVLMALTPGETLTVFEPGAEAFKKLADYKVADSPTYAYPVVSGNRLFVKSENSLILWTFE